MRLWRQRLKWMPTRLKKLVSEGEAGFYREGIMDVSVEHLGDVQFEIKAGQHTIYSDQPVKSGGHDEGMTPPELLLASLGSCAGYYAAMYLRKHKLASEGTIV